MTAQGMRERAGGLRLLRMVMFVNSIAIVALIGLLLLAFHTIQQSREDGIRRACVEQNTRHDETIRQLDVLVKQADVKVGERRRKIESIIEGLLGGHPDAHRKAEALTAVILPRPRAGTTALLVERLAPHADCDARAHRLTQ